MFNFKSLVMGLAFIGASTLAGAHSDHGEVMPITQQQAANASSVVLKSLVKTKELEKVWEGEKPQQTTLKRLKTEKVWESVFYNKLENDATKRNLYVYFDEMGSFLGATHEPMKD